MLGKTPKKPDSKGLNKISHIVALLLPHRVEYMSDGGRNQRSMNSIN